MNDVAAVCNEQGNVVGMMPHPERAVALRGRLKVHDSREHLIFESLRASLSDH
jgi:phosphoribosylformylglycinamidine (FGAM) synthase-like amidotransferase family enzyme